MSKINNLRGFWLKRVVSAGLLMGLLVAAATLYTWQHVSMTQLEQVLEHGKVRFVMRNTGASYAVDAKVEEGLEYHMAELFAEQLGVDFEIIIAKNHSDMINILDKNKADIAIGLTRDVELSVPIHYSTTYKITNEHVIYKRGNNRPRRIQDLTNGSVAVSAQTSYAQQLATHQVQHANLEYHLDETLDTFGLLELVANDELDYTIVNSHDLEMYRRFYPELQIGFQLASNQEIAWALKPITQYQTFNVWANNIKALGIAPDAITNLQTKMINDDSLSSLVDAYMLDLEQTGELEYLLEVYFGHLQKFNYIDTSTFIRRIKNTLPEYEQMFKEAADNDLDWLLLAAIGYQESHWKPNARSPTGVRGLMMLTNATARCVGVSNRVDPEQSIQGGAEYFRRVHERLPESIVEPDRTWMALASYNIGYGHVEDTRKLVQRNGGDPNKWADVRAWLPKKHQQYWHSQTRHGYARGNEAVVYVENIRRYYDLLKWIEQGDRNFLVALAGETV